MSESGPFSGVMTFFTWRAGMTGITDGVYLLLGSRRPRFFSNIMTVAAAFLRVAVDTPETEQLHMFFMLEGYNRPFFVRRIVYSRNRLRYDRMSFADNVGRVDIGNRKSLIFAGDMAGDALGGMTPFAMTG